MEFLRFWGGLFYLLNKIFFNLKERTERDSNDLLLVDLNSFVWGVDKYPVWGRQWKIWSWKIYFAGLWPWLIFLTFKGNFMVAFVELGGAPSMLYGLYLAKHGREENPTSQEKVIQERWRKFSMWSAAVGIVVSLYMFNGLTQISQYAELGVSLGFLVGTYRLAKDRADGYLWYTLMNFSCIPLMLFNGWYVLCVAQVVSLLLVLDAYQIRSKRIKVLA